MKDQKEIVKKVIDYIEKNLNQLRGYIKKYWLFQIPP